MRVAIATTNPSQASLMQEILKPVLGEVRTYDKLSIERGDIGQSNDHVVIIDYSDESIMRMEPVLQLIDKSEPKTILNELPLQPMAHDERLAWRKRLVGEITRLLPDLANQIISAQQATQGHDVWVVGSSSGGPDALNTLLSALPALPISLIIVQHISSDAGTASLQKVLNSRQQTWKVEIAADGARIAPGHCYMVKRDTVVTIEGDSLVCRSYLPLESASPSINATLRSVRRSYAGGVGVIILTGLGDDGSAALKEIQAKTLDVFAQDAESCASRSMPDAARQACVVSASDSVEGIADRLAMKYENP